MNRFVVGGIIVLMIAILAALAFVGWNLYSLAQTQASAYNPTYSQGMMRGGGMMGGYANPDISQAITSTAPYGHPGMMGRGMRGNPGGMMQNCPCAGNTTESTTPSNNAVPTVMPTIAPAGSTSTSSASSSTASSTASSKPANALTGKAGDLNVMLVMNPQPAAFSTTTFDITLTDGKGAAISDASVSLDLTMPSMWMPSNKPQAQSLGNGKYQAVGRFTMRGGWRINIIIDRGGQKQNTYFDIGL